MGFLSMEDRVRECLEDILEQACEVQSFTAGMTFQMYQTDRKTQAAVERKFEIIGEALNRIRGSNPAVLERVRDYRSIISFRNILAHGYDSVEDRVVWGVIENDLDTLIEDVRKQL